MSSIEAYLRLRTGPKPLLENIGGSGAERSRGSSIGPNQVELAGLSYRPAVELRTGLL